MTFKNKVVAFLAASLLSISIFSGAGADSVGGSAELQDGNCSGYIWYGSADFGTYYYDSWNYQWYSNNDGYAYLSYEVYGDQWDQDCGVSVSSAGLTNTTDGSVIDQSYIYASSWYLNGNLQVSGSIDTYWGWNYDSVYLSMASLPGSFSPGTYTGTVDLTISNDAP